MGNEQEIEAAWIKVVGDAADLGKLCCDAELYGHAEFGWLLSLREWPNWLGTFKISD
jgi:hypothetical protein